MMAIGKVWDELRQHGQTLNDVELPVAVIRRIHSGDAGVTFLH